MTQMQHTDKAQAPEARTAARGQGDLAAPAAAFPSHLGARIQTAPRSFVSTLSTTDVLALQRSVGNRETACLLQRQSATHPAPQATPRPAPPAAPVIGAQRSSEMVIQRVYAHVEDSDDMVNVNVLKGSWYNSKQVYIDRDHDKFYIVVGTHKYTNKKIVQEINKGDLRESPSSKSNKRKYKAQKVSEHHAEPYHKKRKVTHQEETQTPSIGPDLDLPTIKDKSFDFFAPKQTPLKKVNVQESDITLDLDFNQGFGEEFGQGYSGGFGQDDMIEEPKKKPKKKPHLPKLTPSKKPSSNITSPKISTPKKQPVSTPKKALILKPQQRRPESSELEREQTYDFFKQEYSKKSYTTLLNEARKTQDPDESDLSFDSDVEEEPEAPSYLKHKDKSVPEFLEELYTRKNSEGELESTARQPIVLMISFNLEKYGKSTVMQSGDVAEQVREAVAQIMEIYHPVVLAFQEVTDAQIFIDGMTFKRRDNIPGIASMNLMRLNFDSDKDYQKYLRKMEKDHGKGTKEKIAQHFTMESMHGIDIGPEFKSTAGGNPEHYPLLFDEARVLEDPEYFVWKDKKLEPAPDQIPINLSKKLKAKGKQIPRPVVYAKLKISTAKHGTRYEDTKEYGRHMPKEVDDNYVYPGETKAQPITLYVGIIHTSPSMKAFSSYVDGILDEYYEVKEYVEARGATAMLLGDVYAEKKARTFLKDIREDDSLIDILPEFRSNMSEKKGVVSLKQRADMAVAPSHMQQLGKARNLLPPGHMPFSIDEEYDNIRKREKATGKQRKKVNTAYEKNILDWRDIHIDHTPVFVTLEVNLDEHGKIQINRKG